VDAEYWRGAGLPLYHLLLVKHYLLAGLLLATLPTLAQTAPDAGIEALDTKYGFRKFKFGTPLSELPEFQKRGKHYIDPMEIRQIGNVDLDRLEFYFYEGKLCSVLFAATSTTGPTKLFDLLVAEYGSPQTLSDTKWAWVGKRATMTYTQQTVTANVGYVGIPVKNAVVTIDTNEALARREAAASAKGGPKLVGTGL
jgi:hypothetical protein